MQIWGSVEKSQSYRFLDIFWNILDKRKGTLGQECVKGGLLAKLEQMPLVSLEKSQLF